MKLKEIKQGMIIFCKNVEEKKMLYDELCRIGNMNSKDDTWEHFNDPSCDCYEIADLNNDTWFFSAKKSTVDFSDLIMPELETGEVLQMRREMSFEFIREYLGCNIGYSRTEMLLKVATNEQILEMCAKWKADQNSEPETEWFWQGRIYEIGEDNRFWQIKDGTGVYDTGCEYRESAEDFMADELKEYCRTHNGNYIAVVEHVCRIKK